MQQGILEKARDIRPTRIELRSLYDIQRTATLNIEYYGARAAKFERWNLGCQVVASIGSLSAVGGFLALGGTEWGKWLAGVVGLFSAVSAALPPTLEFSNKINRFERLHFSYCQLLHMAKALALDIKRSALVTEQQIGASKEISDLYSRLGQLDETDPKSKLIKQFEQEVRVAFPQESLWYPKPINVQEGTGTATATQAGTEARTSTEIPEGRQR
ncbi:MAG: hypothetical protein ABSG32_13440 [Terriglobia bacterium]|jgi:hypothetical protein